MVENTDMKDCLTDAEFRYISQLIIDDEAFPQFKISLIRKLKTFTNTVHPNGKVGSES